ncbi:HvfC/BufC N-terminal domain-containing protein [Nitrogeniibacter aestuarii]|uniref:HvfC/BufC N-terminal domain-containing protein n=1 Tax=Nitrogeniibacter aestuarii TaxID=2815343 RepID=UPI001E423E7F|nr:DNA-binding domain-containing protein [Nitrogeniibacter aestuarii]
MSICVVQQQMQSAITAGGAPPALTGNARGLEVYRIAWRARLIEALRANYPVVHRVLGDEAFEALADAYMRAHPSQNRSIRWFGDRLPSYVAAHPEMLPHPAVADLVRFEWAICLAFDAADFAPLGFEALASTPPDAWPDMTFRLQPGYALIPMAWAVAPIWHAAVNTDDPNAQLPVPEAHAHSVLIWRQQLSPVWRTVEPFEADLLHAVEDGEDFAQLCERGVEALGDEAAAAVLGHLQQWVVDELLAT